MPLWPQFCGGAYQALSPTIADERAVNLFVESTGEGKAKQSTMYGTPGLRLFATVGTAGCRGWFSENGRTFVVIGDTLYEVTLSTATFTARGFVANDGTPVTFASNGQGGNQLALTSAGGLYVLHLLTNVLTSVSLPFVGAVMIAFMDGYGLILQRNSPVIYYTALEDFTSVDALDFVARSGTSDNVIAIAVTRDRLWTLGSETTTQWYNSGDIDTPFLPYPGTTMQVGIASSWVLAVKDDVLYWIASSTSGQRKVVRTIDGAPQIISTPPIDLFLQRAGTMESARVLLYEQGGHVFVLWTVPSSPDEVNTYGFDAREQQWHARASWDAVQGRYVRWKASGSIGIGGDVYVGDDATGDVYRLDLETYDDNGTLIRRQRRAPYIGAENQYAFLQELELGTQAGVGTSTGQGANPVAHLAISRDAGQTWVSAGDAPLGQIGQYQTRTIWRQLGRARMDRLMVDVTMTDPVKCVWGPGAWIRLQKGTDQL